MSKKDRPKDKDKDKNEDNENDEVTSSSGGRKADVDEEDHEGSPESGMGGI